MSGSESRPSKPRYRMHGDFRMPLGFPADGFASGLGYEAQAGDVFVASYPKCGTTWLQYIVYLLLNRGRGLPAGSSLGDVFPHLEEVGAEAVRAFAAPRLIKTHLPHALTPWNARARYLYVARNPFDCVVSFYHHTRGFVQHYDFAHGTFDEYFECFIRGEVDFGDYFEHLSGWHRRAEVEDNVFFTTYERLKAHLRAVIAAIAGFVEPALDADGADSGLLSRVADESRFERMRRDQHRWSSSRPAGMPRFVRKGIVGDWRNHLSPAQLERLLDALESRVPGGIASRLWPETIADVRQLLS